jgi:hypothetical protein
MKRYAPFWEFRKKLCACTFQIKNKCDVEVINKSNCWCLFLGEPKQTFITYRLFCWY